MLALANYQPKSKGRMPLLRPHQFAPARRVKIVQLFQIALRFFERHFMDRHFKISVHHARHQNVLERRVNVRRAVAQFLEYKVIIVRRLHLQLDKLIGHRSEPRTLRTLQKQQKFLAVGRHVVEHLVKALLRDRTHHLGLFFHRQIGKFAQRRLVRIYHKIVRFADERFKQLRFTGIISIKCTRGNARSLYNISQRRRLEALAEKLRFRRAVDKLQRGHFTIVHF